MSSHNAVVEWLPSVCTGLAMANGVLVTYGVVEGDKARISRYAARVAAFEFVGGVSDIAQGNWGIGAGNSVAVAIYLLIWWHNGGGDGTKRRLKKLKEKFVGTRRTAPLAA